MTLEEAIPHLRRALRADDFASSGDRAAIETVLSALEQAQAERDRLHAGLSCALDDLAAILRALGESDAARPETPHHVMLGCIERVSTLRRERDEAQARVRELEQDKANLIAAKFVSVGDAAVRIEAAEAREAKLREAVLRVRALALAVADGIGRGVVGHHLPQNCGCSLHQLLSACAALAEPAPATKPEENK